MRRHDPMLVLLSLACVSLAPATSRAEPFFLQTNLVTDDQSVHHAVLTDPNLKKPWSIAASATSPFWVSNNGTGTAAARSAPLR